ncbi:MAG: hypothetical protein JO112_19855 [Planctomycetes bacterium]|nr:hypothetical protein [Planctomycetota bacterium]
MVPVPVSAKMIPAYTQVTRDYLLNPKTGILQVIYVPPQEVKLNKDLVTTTDKIFGRVVNHDKPAGYAFTESDFLPPGTLPGVVAGIPPGKRAVVVDADKIKGIQALKAGNHFDLLGSLPLDDRKNPTANLMLMPGVATWPQKRALEKVLVENGVIVEPMTTRQVPVGTVTRPGYPTPTKAVQEVVLAVDPKEMAPLTEALDLNASITCVARSGRPDDPASVATPGSNPSKRQVVEIITGGKRQFLEFPLTPDQFPPESNSPSSNPTAPENSRATGVDTLSPGP